MKSKRGTKATAGGKRKARPVRDLPGTKGANPKGGSSAISEVMKNFGGALNTAGRG